ncbi:MAG: phage terminase large subunit [Rhodospirillales bacterium]|nr:phage terminase large subunit [Alphaproteobacteria bacterium]MCB9987043.1 phage terminase large subunit [Rhodospirillales bacterium]USO08188.1 MAG: phage terminase large subunit [Rhodospirillales bacterium]
MNDFPLFLSIWNRAQGQTTPHVHFRIAHWLSHRDRAGDTRLLLMAFRSCGKSTIVGLYAAWLLWRDPDLRILVLAADGTLAAKMVRNTRRIIERHPLTAHLCPDRADQWAADRFTVARRAEWRDPSMVAFGIGANITGSRADVVICDDVEVPNTCDSAEKRVNLRDRLAELSFVLVPGGTQIYVGTPHAFDTIYAVAPGDGPETGAPFLAGYKDLRVPLLADDGTCAWPERFSPAAIADLRKSGGPRRFVAQMMLAAQPVAAARLNPDLLCWHEDAVAYSEAGGAPVLRIGGRRMESASAWWDPAFGDGGDGSVVAVVYGDGQGEYWLQRLEYLRVRAESGEDAATQQCRAVARICAEMHLSAIAVEINGIGKFLPAILRRELRGGAAVIEAASRRAKDVRIVEAFDAVLAARALHVHRSAAATPFIEEMRNWRPGGKGRDDGLDAVAGALAQQPVRVRGAGAGGAGIRRAGWQGADARYRARSEFNVMEQGE